MATTFKVFVNGQYKTFTSAEYEAEFGYKDASSIAKQIQKITSNL